MILLEQLKKIDNDQFIGIMESLSDPIRINIIELMMGGEICVCDIVKVTGLSQSKISYHIKILKDSGLISDRQEGRWVYYKLDLEVLSDIKNWIGNLIQSSSSKRSCE
ncbi:metalloregulator ArsR/SmtB family transcription factor [Prochlorococcus sp. AH-716-O10]|nr:metalloregulator ArsR/SmtB family transcription factor [Prochlorococcus sp. AH-716-O10]